MNLSKIIGLMLRKKHSFYWRCLNYTIACTIYSNFNKCLISKNGRKRTKVFLLAAFAIKLPGRFAILTFIPPCLWETTTFCVARLQSVFGSCTLYREYHVRRTQKAHLFTRRAFTFIYLINSLLYFFKLGISYMLSGISTGCGTLLATCARLTAAILGSFVHVFACNGPCIVHFS